MCSATWNLGTNSAFALGPRKTTEYLDQIGWSQDLPDSNWHLARSPAFEYTNPNVSPYLAVALFWKHLPEFVSCAYFGWATNNFRWYLERIYIHACMYDFSWHLNNCGRFSIAFWDLLLIQSTNESQLINGTCYTNDVVVLSDTFAVSQVVFKSPSKTN
jgi:hypothetical protein